MSEQIEGKCPFDAVRRILGSFDESPQAEAERKAATTHLEHCSLCQEDAEEFLREYQEDPGEQYLPPGANNIWELFELARVSSLEFEKTRFQVEKQLIGRFLTEPEPTRELIRLIARISRALYFLSMGAPLPVTGGSITMVRETLISLKGLVGEEALMELLGLKEFDEVMGTWRRLEDLSRE